MEFSRDASLLAHQIDIAQDRVLLVRLTAQDYREASFLDQRLLTQDRPMQWADWAALEAESAAIPASADFIFHIGHVGSTLISRLLGELPGVLAVREPQILRQFAELKALDGRPESPWHPERYAPGLRTVCGWLSRSFAPNQRAMVKATSFVGEIASDILMPDSKALFLTLSPERYVETILAGDNSRQELAMLSGSRLARLHNRLGGAHWNLWELPEATRAALGWACEATALESAQPAGEIYWYDFDSFLANPTEALAKIATFFDHETDRATIDSLTSGPIMQRYSKAPELGYSADLREQVLAQARRDHAPAIADALKWLDNAAVDHDIIATALNRATGNRDVQATA